MTSLLGILFVSVFGFCAVALCHPPFCAWLLSPLRQWTGWDKRRGPKA